MEHLGPIVLLYVGLPLCVFLLGRLALRMRRQRFPVETEIIVAQRLARAVVAVILVYNAASALLRIPGFVHQMALADESTLPLMMGTVAFYLYDSVMLVIYSQWELTMWLHHLAALGLYAFATVYNVAHSGLCMALLGEALVPWGFMLFYLRASSETKSRGFIAVCIGGMTTLLSRAAMWLFILFVHNTQNLSLLPIPFSIFINMTLLVGLYLEASWFRLYQRNLSKALQKETMGTRTPSMLQL